MEPSFHLSGQATCHTKKPSNRKVRRKYGQRVGAAWRRGAPLGAYSCTSRTPSRCALPTAPVHPRRRLSLAPCQPLLGVPASSAGTAGRSCTRELAVANYILRTLQSSSLGSQGPGAYQWHRHLQTHTQLSSSQFSRRSGSEGVSQGCPCSIAVRTLLLSSRTATSNTSLVCRASSFKQGSSTGMEGGKRRRGPGEGALDLGAPRRVPVLRIPAPADGSMHAARRRPRPSAPRPPPAGMPPQPRRGRRPSGLCRRWWQL